jgi:glucose/arabinose dehydrogenase
MGATRVPAGFVNEVLVASLNEPTTLVFAPGGALWIAERGGRVRVLPPGAGQVNPVPLLTLANIDTQLGERGLVGMALDPAFASNGYLYLFYTAATPLRDRVARVTVAGGAVVPGSEVVLWQDVEASPAYHHGGGLVFGADGRLYVSTGDGTDAEASQSLQRTRGKLLRLNPDGSIPADNPFHDGPGPNLDEIWALGLRNPFRMSLDSPSGRLYIGDVGATAFEEVNVGARGANYGWPLCEGACGTAGLTNPLHSYSHAGRDASVIGGFVYRGTRFPAEYRGRYFFGDYVQNWIRTLTLDASGNVTGDLPFEPENGQADGPYGEIVDLRMGPDGALYYVDLGVAWEGQTRPGAVRRIRYTAGNQPPVAVASAMPTRGPAPLQVSFSSAGSSDPEDDPLGFSWDFGDGSFGSGPSPSHTYVTRGSFTARLTVSDGTNQVLADPLSIRVGGPPSATILQPPSGSTFRAGDTIAFSGAGTDEEDGTLPLSAYTWTGTLLHESHGHPFLGPLPGIAAGQFWIPTTGHDWSGNTRLQLTLALTDSDGLIGSTSVLLLPDKVNVTLGAQPPGLDLLLDGVPRPTPFTVDTLVAFRHTVDAPDQGRFGAHWKWQSWSDGGAQAHTLVVPPLDVLLTAAFREVPLFADGFEQAPGGVAHPLRREAWPGVGPP